MNSGRDSANEWEPRNCFRRERPSRERTKTTVLTCIWVLGEMKRWMIWDLNSFSTRSWRRNGPWQWKLQTGICLNNCGKLRNNHSQVGRSGNRVADLPNESLDAECITHLARYMFRMSSYCLNKIVPFVKQYLLLQENIDIWKIKTLGLIFVVTVYNAESKRFRILCRST